MYYFCYVSEEKVGQILSQDSNGVVDRITETAEEFKEGKGSLSAKIIGIFSSKAEYGKKKTLRFSHEKRHTIVSKLLAALHVLQTRIPDMVDLTNVANPADITPGTYLYQGSFKVVRYDNRFAYLESELPCGKSLMLTCSLRYFSDMWNQEKEFVPHSGNVMFFNGEIEPTFKALIYVLQMTSSKALGTPLYLGLPLDGPLQL